MANIEYQGYTIREVGGQYIVYNPKGRRIDDAMTESVARLAVDEDIMHHRRQFIVTTKGGCFVGLFNYGRTYRAADKPCVLDCDVRTARELGKTFGGKVYLLAYNKHDARPWSLFADGGQFWQQTGGNYFYRGRCINQLKAA